MKPGAGAPSREDTGARLHSNRCQGRASNSAPARRFARLSGRLDTSPRVAAGAEAKTATGDAAARYGKEFLSATCGGASRFSKIIRSTSFIDLDNISKGEL